VSTTGNATPRANYHHGNLRNALAEAAMGLAREGGPEAVVLREAARRVGVSATAAYRHFAEGQGDLLGEVKNMAQAVLGREIGRALAECEVPGADRRRLAVDRLRAAGEAYVRFAFAEPGLFNTAFCRDRTSDARQPEALHYRESPAYIMLSGLLDELVASGAMPTSRRPFAEAGVWGTIHGLSVLFVDGPLRGITGEERHETVRNAIDGIVRSLTCAED